MRPRINYPTHEHQGRMKISQVPTKGFHACMGSLTPRSPATSHHNEAARVAFGRSESLAPLRSEPSSFRCSLARPHEPLPTLRLTPHAVPDARLAERRGWLLLRHGGLPPPAFRQFAWHTRSGLAQLRHPAPRTMVSLLNGTHCERLAPLGEDRFCVGARSGPMSCVPGDFADQAICATAVPFHIGIGAAPGSCR